MKLRAIGVCVIAMMAGLALSGFFCSEAVASETDDAPAWEGKRAAERFAPLDWLVGEWQGYGQFPSRTTYIHKKYYYDVGGMFFIERTLSMFPPEEETSTEYEIHQDFTSVYRDDSSGGFLAKGFFVEGFVWSSKVDAGEDGSTIVLETVDIDNAPPGMRGRITYTRESEDSYTATFEIAMPGAEYKLFEELVMDRVK